MAARGSEKGPGLGCSIFATLSLLVASYVGWAAVRGALETRRDTAALERSGVRVTGTVIENVSVTGRTGGYRARVKYVADGREYHVLADRGYGVKEAVAHPVGSPMDVVYVQGQPRIARVVGYEVTGWIGLAVVGSAMLLLPLLALALLVWAGLLFARPPRIER